MCEFKVVLSVRTQYEVAEQQEHIRHSNPIP